MLALGHPFVNRSQAPPNREAHTAVWTGSQMIIWGGIGINARLNDTYSYTPDRVLYLYQKQ